MIKIVFTTMMMKIAIARPRKMGALRHLSLHLFVYCCGAIYSALLQCYCCSPIVAVQLHMYCVSNVSVVYHFCLGTVQDCLELS